VDPSEEFRKTGVGRSQWPLYGDKNWLQAQFRNESGHTGLVSSEVITMQRFFFDMKDGVPHRDTVGIEFKTNAEAIWHCREIAKHFRDESLRDDQDLEISVVNALGREIHREFVHRE
jgi:hypothetical protein